jgi:hypothetical protein
MDVLAENLPREGIPSLRDRQTTYVLREELWTQITENLEQNLCGKM